MPKDLTLDNSYIDKDHLFRQLVVVGNGLDLYCGLASSFASFFNPRRSVLQTMKYSVLHDVPNWEDRLVSEKLTAWDIILEISAVNNNKPKNWNDIESAIAEWIIPRKQADATHPVLENKHLKRLLGILTGRSQPLGSGCYSEGEVARFLKHVYGESGWSRSVLLDRLMIELHKLEKELAEYLHDAVLSTDGYQEKLAKVLHGMVFDEVEAVDERSHELSMLSFNYTIASGFLQNEQFDLVSRFVNIHGNLYGETVIGIDATGHMVDKDIAQFTKTYRIMGMGTSAVGGLVYSGREEGPGSSTALMKFFGHSLSKADYSYFQSLFDVVDLYGGSTRLVFYYAPHGDDDYDTACLRSKKGVMDSVTRLLTKYGDTLDNNDHGRNLIHKLLLEGRLVVKCIPGAREMWEEDHGVAGE